MGVSVVAGCDASPALEPVEHVLDAATLPVERLVSDRHLPVRLDGMHALAPRLARASRNGGLVAAAIAGQVP